MNDYQRIEKIIQYIDAHRSEQPDLEVLAAQAGLSRFHLHRLFSRWAGMTPKTFLRCLNMAHAKELLTQGQSVLDTALDTGLSGPSRLHDLCVRLEAATPGELKSGGAGWTIVAGFAATPFGTCLIGENARGICHLSFVPSRERQRAEQGIRADWPQARIRWDNDSAVRLAASVFDRSRGDATWNGKMAAHSGYPLKALVRGTEFQLRVWRALLEIPAGALASYADVAETVCSRSATRAVASAIARNRIAYLIPCHRVIRATGVIGQYRWGSERKQAMIAWETGGAAADRSAERATDGRAEKSRS